MAGDDHAMLSVDEFRAALRAKRSPSGGVYRVSTDPAIAVGPDKARTLRFVFSDGSVDRMGDTIDADGWDTRDFDNNPVALWAHDSSAPPIGQASNLSVEGSKLKGDIEFAPPEVYDFADTIYRLVKGRFVRAVSVGFLPVEYKFVENDPKRAWGIDFLKQQLLEISVCPVPANPNALQEARSKGIDTRPLLVWAEQTLDLAGGSKTLISRSELEKLRKQAKESPMAARKTPARKTPPVKKDDDPTDPPEGNCGRDKDEDCGMKDPDECQVHADTQGDDAPPIDPSDEKALRRALTKLTGKRVILRADDGSDDDDKKPSDDEAPHAHEDAIRLAHKALKTSKSYLGEAVSFHSKAVDHLGQVVDALDSDSDGKDDDPKAGETDDEDKDEPTDEEKAAQIARAEARRARLKLA